MTEAELQIALHQHLISTKFSWTKDQPRHDSDTDQFTFYDETPALELATELASFIKDLGLTRRTR